MASSKIDKGVLVLAGNVLELFGMKGFVSGRKWCMNLFAGAFVEVDPVPASPEIESIVGQDIADGNRDKIDHVQVNPNTAVRRYLEGRINREHVVSAHVTEQCVMFDGVEFVTTDGPQLFKVVVRQTDMSAATIDEHGEVV